MGFIAPYSILGCRQAVRHSTLTAAFVGSNPATPAKNTQKRIFSASVCFLCRMRTCEGLRVKKSSLKKIRSHMRADFVWCFSIFIMYDAFLFYNKDTDTHLYRDGYFRAGTETRPYRVVQTSSFLILPSSPLRGLLLPLCRRNGSIRCSRNARRRAHGHSHRRHSRNVP